jgi:hypothetical protein
MWTDSEVKVKSQLSQLPLSPPKQRRRRRRKKMPPPNKQRQLFLQVLVPNKPLQSR